MSKSRLGFLWTMVFVLAGGIASIPSGTEAGPNAGPEFPASWFGIWEFEGIERDCTSGDTLAINPPEPDTLCTGDVFDFEEEGVEFDCTGTISDTVIDVDCSGQFTEGGCTATFTVTVDAVRSGDTVTGSQTVELAFSGDCGPFPPPDSCTEETFTGTRIADGSACPPTPSLPTSWGQLKIRFP